MNIILAAEALRAPWAGIGRYTYELARGLQSHPAVGEVRLLDRFRWFHQVDDLISMERVGPEPKNLALSVRSRPMLRNISRALVPSLRTLRCLPYRNHIYHSPNYAVPRFPGKCVSTVHDLSVIRHPEFHPKERVDHLIKLFPGILKRADLLLTDSEFSRTEILDHFKLAPDRVVAVPLGVDPRFQPMATDAMEKSLAKYGLIQDQYTLSVGTIEPRKNLERLIAAYETLPLSVRRKWPLVLAGNEGWNNDAILRRIEKATAEGWLRYLRLVSESELPALYAGARVFACVSLYEGFGLPLLEALASGAPALCSRSASLPEIGGEAVRYVDPLRVDSIREALLDLLKDEGQRKLYRQLAVKQAAPFTWTRTVDETVRAYRTIL